MKKLKFAVKLFAMLSLVVIIVASIVVGLLLDKQEFFAVTGDTNLIVFLVSKVFALLAISAYLFVCVWKEQEIGFAQVSFLVALQVFPTAVRLLLKLESYGLILSVGIMFVLLLLLIIIIFSPLIKEIKEDEARMKNFDDGGQFKGPGI
ncbi:MAG: hypothetical protein ACOX4W_03305 [Bacilli bacterium]